MKFSLITISLLASLTIASPMPKKSSKATTTAAAAAVATSSASTGNTGSVLTSQSYNDISISGGTAGNAKAEADALFSAIDKNDLANVSADDLEIIANTHDVAEDAETDAFNPAIEAAGGASAATALQNGKIKNKVLKLTATVLKLQIEAAQGEDTSADLAKEQTKLDNNIKLDTAAAGQESTAVSFDGTT